MRNIEQQHSHLHRAQGDLARRALRNRPGLQLLPRAELLGYFAPAGCGGESGCLGTVCRAQILRTIYRSSFTHPFVVAATPMEKPSAATVTSSSANPIPIGKTSFQLL